MNLIKLPGKRMRVFLAADRVGTICERGLLRPRVECASAEVEPGEPGAEPWAPALAALTELFASRAWHGLPIDIALSSEFVRFALVPGINRRLSSAELQGLAQSMLARVLGDSAPAWAVRYCAADASSVLAAATEKSLLAALEDFARSVKCTLRSVSPAWSCAVNLQRRRLARRTAWLVLAEPRFSAFGLIENGRWRTVRAKALDAEQGSDVARLIERESRVLGAETREVIVLGESAGEQFGPEWKVERAPAASARLGAMPVECRPAMLAGC